MDGPNTNTHQSVLQSALALNRLGPKVDKNRRKVPKSSQIGPKSSTKGLEIGQKVRMNQQTIEVHEGKESEMSKEKKSKKKKKHLKVIEANDFDVHEEKKARKSPTKGLDIGQKVQLRQQTFDVHEGKEAEMSKEKKSKKKKKHLKVIESNNVDAHKEKKAHKCSTKRLDISQKVSLKQQEAEISKEKKSKKKKNCLICEKYVKKSQSKHNDAV